MVQGVLNFQNEQPGPELMYTFVFLNNRWRLVRGPIPRRSPHRRSPEGSDCACNSCAKFRVSGLGLSLLGVKRALFHGSVPLSLQGLLVGFQGLFRDSRGLGFRVW